MTDERIVQILEEIRDLQKRYLEKYEAAVQNQKEAIALQKRAVTRQWLIPLVVMIVVLGVLVALVVLYK